ncbi:hypothetical protein [Streptomyces clavuligerus]|nr:hypothetical protein [Streptomyces clavuligerus]ANW19297.1 hypothetical protein BB341_14245 [Streptomyces clavuligerus]AXU13899.1 hypothetical protein D1794_14850 [Streptomyces clavuligerus]EDY50978.1 conserved hypothetical protein [Streptomyces clavuligerus]MBY6303868.1 hypothetical protein [Streptomyces clavuligerus]QCS06672.1 hypothetical protein CRV15_14200 [Streptomyces clavuligerus]
MHMGSAPQLPAEDRAEFERVLEEALRTASDRPDLAALGERLNATQLRTMALNAIAVITDAAAAEYAHYTEIRAEAHAPPGSPPPDGTAASRGSPGPSGPPGRMGRPGPTATAEPAPDGTGTTGTTGGSSSSSGPGVPGGFHGNGTRTASSSRANAGKPGRAGLTAMITVLAPVLAATAALALLLVGHLLKLLDPPPPFASTLITTGWFFAALTAAALLIAAAGLLTTALRNTSTQVPAEERNDELPDELARAKDAWRHALLERGILPFLRETLADPGADPAAPLPPRSRNRLPRVGYSGPDWSGPGEGATEGQRPAFSSPDFTSPDFGGPETRTS